MTQEYDATTGKSPDKRIASLGSSFKRTLTPEKVYESPCQQKDRRIWAGMMDGLRNFIGIRRKSKDTPHHQVGKHGAFPVNFVEGRPVGTSVLKHTIAAASSKTSSAPASSSSRPSSNGKASPNGSMSDDSSHGKLVGSGKQQEGERKIEVAWNCMDREQVSDFLRIHNQYAQQPFHAPERQTKKRTRRLSEHRTYYRY
eukprot:CAMPEP_0181316200 /NCGR_PEP_ID=MMETSP1101-20121128/15770_1 /TAXON_ID=46948 /ORGANISM="Rhodomonas abbreviata, Strain Caron Lab Isolate" /LENGTH=198 /DNA_ID=CAMNT_0023423435 /DNA_START=80 /DNA_END=676 /DNA_ORIENTATION=-